MIDICGFMDATDDYGSSLENDQPKKAFQLDFELEDQIILKNQTGAKKPLSPIAFKKVAKKKPGFAVKQNVDPNRNLIKKRTKPEEPSAASDVPAYFNKRASDILDQNKRLSAAGEASLFESAGLLDVAPEIFQQLFDHQIVGINFLYENFKNKNGCILADDMGLGKTV